MTIRNTIRSNYEAKDQKKSGWTRTPSFGEGIFYEEINETELGSKSSSNRFAEAVQLLFQWDHPTVHQQNTILKEVQKKTQKHK